MSESRDEYEKHNWQADKNMFHINPYFNIITHIPLESPIFQYNHTHVPIYFNILMLEMKSMTGHPISIQLGVKSVTGDLITIFPKAKCPRHINH